MWILPPRLVVFIIVTLISSQITTTTADNEDWIETIDIGIYDNGQWRRAHTCPPGSFVTGYGMVVNQNAEVISMYFQCSQLNLNDRLVSTKVIQIGVTFPGVIPKGKSNVTDYGVGFAVHHWTEGDGRRYVGEREMIFSGQDKLPQLPNGAHEIVRDETMCDDSWGICGVQPKMNADGILTRIRLKCCYYCFPSEVEVILRDYTNPGSTEMSHSIRKTLGSQLNQGDHADGHRNVGQEVSQDASSGTTYQTNEEASASHSTGVNTLDSMSSSGGSSSGRSVSQSEGTHENNHANVQEGSMLGVNTAENTGHSRGGQVGQQSSKGGSQSTGQVSGRSDNFGSSNNAGGSISSSSSDGHGASIDHSSGGHSGSSQGSAVDQSKGSHSSSSHGSSVSHSSAVSASKGTGLTLSQSFDRGNSRHSGSATSHSSGTNTNTNKGFVSGSSSGNSRSESQGVGIGHGTGSTRNDNVGLSKGHSTGLSTSDSHGVGLGKISGGSSSSTTGQRDSLSKSTSDAHSHSRGGSQSGSSTEGQVSGTSSRQSSSHSFGINKSFGASLFGLVSSNLDLSYNYNTGTETGKHSENSRSATRGWENHERTENTRTHSTGSESSNHRERTDADHNSNDIRINTDQSKGTQVTSDSRSSQDTSIGIHTSNDGRLTQDRTSVSHDSIDRRDSHDLSAGSHATDDTRFTMDSSSSTQNSKNRRVSQDSSIGTHQVKDERTNKDLTTSTQDSKGQRWSHDVTHGTHYGNVTRLTRDSQTGEQRTLDYRVNTDYQHGRHGSRDIRVHLDYQDGQHRSADYRVNNELSRGRSFNKEVRNSKGFERGFHRRNENILQSGVHDNYHKGHDRGFEQRQQYAMQISIQKSAQAMFSAKYGTTSSSGFNWGSSASSMWTTEEEEVDTFTCEPMSRCVLKQLQGRCGVVEIHTPKLIKSIESLSGNTTVLSAPSPGSQESESQPESATQDWILVPNMSLEQPSGNWGQAQVCPDEMVVTGHRLKILPKFGPTGLELRCSGPNEEDDDGHTVETVRLTSLQGPRGTWEPEIVQTSHASGYSFLNILNGTLRKGNQEVTYSGVEVKKIPIWALPYATTLEHVTCPKNHAVCGIRTMLDKENKGLLTSISLKCCPHCKYEQRMEILSSFQNRGTTNTVHVIRMNVGTQKGDNHNSQNASSDNFSVNSNGINRLGLQAGFAAQFGNNTTHGFDWSQTATSLFTEEKEIQVTYECEAGHVCIYKQLVGYCANLRTPTPHTIEESIPIEKDEEDENPFDLSDGELWVVYSNIELSASSGIWEVAETCPPGSIVTNHQFKIDSTLGLTGLVLKCSERVTGSTEFVDVGHISSGQGSKGKLEARRSKNHVAIGFNFFNFFRAGVAKTGYRSVVYEGGKRLAGPHTGVNNVTEIDWTCPPKRAVCGIQTMMDQDDKGIVVNLKLKCCYDCEPTENWITLDLVKNMGSYESTRNVQSLLIGSINLFPSNNENVVNTIGKNPMDFKTIFSKKFGSNSTTQFDWTETDDSLWSSVKTQSFQYKCEGGHVCKFQQLVGSCGDVKIHTPYTVIHSSLVNPS